MAFHQKLQHLRKQKALTQEELAEQLHVSRQAVSKWESGQTMPETDKIVQIANLFDASLDDLLKDTPATQCQNAALPTNLAQHRNVNRRYITGIAALSLGFVGVMIFCILSIIHPISLANESGVHTGFGAFLSAYDMWFIFLICCGSAFIGLLLITKDAIVYVLRIMQRAFLRQPPAIKWGIALCAAGVMLIPALLIATLNQTESVSSSFMKRDSQTGELVDAITHTTSSASILPVVFLVAWLLVMVAGLVVLTIGLIKKAKNKG